MRILLQLDVNGTAANAPPGTGLFRWPAPGRRPAPPLTVERCGYFRRERI